MVNTHRRRERQSIEPNVKSLANNIFPFFCSRYPLFNSIYFRIKCNPANRAAKLAHSNQATRMNAAYLFEIDFLFLFLFLRVSCSRPKDIYLCIVLFVTSYLCHFRAILSNKATIDDESNEKKELLLLLLFYLRILFCCYLFNLFRFYLCRLYLCYLTVSFIQFVFDLMNCHRYR